jgi:Universal stress protein family
MNGSSASTSLCCSPPKPGDAWLLDASEQLAARLARDGDPEPIQIEDTETTFAISWKGHYRIEGSAFVYMDRDTRGIDVADTILSYAADVSADFIVMGGYGHSRLREVILGGTTRGLLSSMTIPTLMSH